MNLLQPHRVTRKLLLRIVFVLLGIWSCLLIIFYFSGNKHEDHILRLLQKQLSSHLSTEIHIPKKGIHFSVFRNFPNVSLELRNILIKSSPDIKLTDFNYKAKDTLLYADEISLLFNLRSLITRKYELKKIVISQAKLNLLNDNSGNNNYQVFKSSAPGAESDSVIIRLTNIDLNDAEIHYIDAGQPIHINAFANNSQISGEFSKNDFDVQIKTSMQSINLDFKEEEYINETSATISLQIVRSGNSYSFNKGQADLFGINMVLQGIYDKNKEFYKFSIETKGTPLAKISMPAWIEFLNKNNIQIERGDMDIRLSISGYSRQKGALISSEFVIQKASLKNPQKNIRIRNIFLQGRYALDANQITTINLDTFSMRSDKSRIVGACKVHDLNKPSIQGRISGMLELQKIMIFESVAKRIEIDGTIEGELQMDGILSREQNSWRTNLMNVFKKGQLEIRNGFVRPLIKPLPAVKVNGIIRLKGLQNVWLENINLRTGQSDFLLSGSVSDLPMFSGDRSIFPVYQCSVSSNEFHVEDFLLEDEPDSKEKELNVQLPDSMIVIAKIKVNNFYFGKFSATNCSGSLHYRPKSLIINDFSMKSQKGEIFSEIEISQQKNRLKTKSQANLQKVDLGDMFYAFNNFGQKVICAENLDGSLTGNVTVFANWDLKLNPILEDLELQSSISIENGELIDYQPLLGLSKFIKVEELRHIKFEKLETDILIDKGIVNISETNINSSAISLVGSGEHDFDNRYKYSMQVHLSDILWNKAKKKKPENSEFGYIVDDGLGRTTIPLIIRGMDKEFEVYYDRQKGRSTFREKVQDEKKEFRSLFKSDNETDQIQNEQELRMEWEDDTVNSDRRIKESNQQGPEKTGDKEFIIEWDDE